MAVRFDASGESYTSTSSPPVGSAFTVTCWVKLSADRNTWSAAWSSDSSTTNYSYLATDVDGVTMKWWTLVGGNERIINGPVMTVGTWYRFAAVCNGANATLYYGTASGVLSTGTSATWQTLTTSTTFRVGVDPFTDEWLNGCVANVKHWSTNLTQAEIEHELGHYVPDQIANLVRWHPFVANETTDYSGNARTLSGGTGTVREDGPPIPWRGARPQVVLPAAAAGGAVTLDGAAPAATSATGSASVTRPLSTSADASAGATGALATNRALDGTAAASNHATGSLSRSAGLAGTTGAASDVTGNLGAQRAVEATSSVASHATASASVTRPLDSTAASASGATGDLSIAGQATLSGTSAAASSAQANLSATRGLTATAHASSSATGTVLLQRPLAATAGAASSATATLQVTSPGTAPDEVFMAGSLVTGWAAGEVCDGWTAGRIATRWTAHELI